MKARAIPCTEDFQCAAGQKLSGMNRVAPRVEGRLALLDTRARPDSAEEIERRRTLMRIAQRARSFARVHKRMLPLLVHPSRLADEAIASTVDGMAQRTGIPGYLRQQRAIMSRRDFRPMLGRIACPTLVLCGREDALTPLAFHEELADGIPGARLVVVEVCGHLSTLERPGHVSASLREWLMQEP
jgi:pimeloyl-ACP methyl ester carboxylesterase